MKLTTILHVQNAMSLPGTDTVLIQRLIEQVERLCEDYTGRKFLFGEYIERISGNDGTVLFLSTFPIHRVISVKVDDEIINDYEADVDMGLLYRRGAGWRAGFCNIEVKYEAGYDINRQGYEPPADLEGAVIEEVISRYENLKTETRTGENLVDLRTNFLTSRARDFFSRQRKINV